LGWEHITDFNGYDHILFIVALASVFRWEDWKKLLLLLTAFTVGHCITLVLSGLSWITISPNLIETIIPLTILFTCIQNIRTQEEQNSWIQYILVTFFGLIHGMGFSNYFKSLLGSSNEIIFPLFAFNVGIEFGQIMIVGIFLLVRTLLSMVLNPNSKESISFISGMAAGPALILFLQRLWIINS